MRTGSRLRTLPALLAAAALSLAAAPASALSPRVAHTATLLPTGNMLIAGGLDNNGDLLNSSDLYLASTSSLTVAGANMTVARASHTATVLPNGLVLIAGGVGGTTGSPPSTVLNTVEIYTPATNSFSAAGIGGANGGAMSSPRYNHTATLLNNGSVLLCAGQNTATTVTNACDYYTPSGATVPGGAACGSAGGCVNPAPSLAFGRAAHTASLLTDGTVWFAGGWNPAASATNGWTDTTERFTPTGGGSFGSGPNLIEARGLHTATVMGDGKVLVAGGFNANPVLANQGFLDTEEIYDPVANSMSPGAQMLTRRAMQTAVLDADGAVSFFGGLGNITTTYNNSPGITTSNLTLTNSFASLQPNVGIGNFSPPGAYFYFVAPGQFLSQPVVGTVVDGSVLFSSPSFDFGAGIVYWTPGNAGSTATGLQASLAGFNVDCMTPGAAPPGNCGFLSPTQKMPWTNLDQATWYFKPLSDVAADGPATGGSIGFASDLTQSAPGPEPISAASTLDASVTIPMPLVLLGATISSGTLSISNTENALSLTQSSSYTLTLTGGNAIIPTAPPTVVASDGNGGAQITFTAQFSNLVGEIAWASSDPSYVLPSPSVSVPEPGTSPTVALNVNVNYVASEVAINGNITTDVSTIVVRSMILGSPEYFDPKTNQTSLTSPDGGAVGVSYTAARLGQTATVLTNNDMYITGGYNCSTPGFGTCAPLAAESRYDFSYIYKYNDSASAGTLLTARALHTSTLLPDGTILVAGGTNGPNILSSAEIYSPAAGTSAFTASPMSQVRDQHTSTLLPDGRVLIAGGFTTNSVSSDATNGAEIYYPDTQYFVPTSSMSVPRYGHTATMLPDGNVMVVGGLTTGGAVTGNAEVFHSTTSAWVSALINQNLPPRRAHTATLLKDGRVLVIGGTNSSGPLKTVYAFNPAAPAAGWVAQDNLPHQLYSHSATLLFDGRVLVAGGNDGFGEYNASYIFNPQASAGSQWTSTAASPLLQPRFGHTATLLPNDTVMITGGSTASGIVPTEIEVFHISASSWAAGGINFKDGPREFNTMTLAADGNVYALGGSNGAIGGSGTSLISAVDRSYFTAPVDEFTKNTPPSVRQSIINTTSASPFQAGAGPLPANGFTVNGTQFRGATEASGGGSASANSSFSFPHLILQQIEGSGGGSSQGNSGFVVDLTTQVFLNPANLATENTSLTVSLPATSALLPTGWYSARTGANDVYSNGFFVQAGPAKPTAAPTGLAGATQGVSSITWTWNSIAGVDGYNVYLASTSVFIGTVAATGGTVTFVQTGLSPNAQGQVKVAGYTMTGDGPSALSPATAVSPITTIASFLCQGVTTTSITWTWNSVPSAQTYNVYNSTYSASAGSTIAVTASAQWSDVNLATNTARSILVAAVTNGVQGPLSPSATCYTLAAAPLPPTLGQNLPLMTSTEATSVSFNWIADGNPGGTTYEAVATSYSGAVTTVTTTGNQAYFGGLSPSDYYTGRIFAQNLGGVLSAPLLTGTTFTLANPPTPVTIQGTTPVMITGSWNTNSNSTMTYYQVIDSTDDFTTFWSTAVAFSTHYASSTFALSGLLTGTTYWIGVQAENPFGQINPLVAEITTTTYNGGAPAGSLAGVLTAEGTSEFSGNLGGPSARVIDMRSPGGAFPENTNVTISTYGLADHGGTLCPGGVPGAGGGGVALSIVDDPALQPSNPVFLSASYAPSELGTAAASEVALERFDPGSGTCVPLPTTFNTAAQTFFAQLNHFSLYQLVAVPLATSAASARIFPNPYRAAVDGYVTIDLVPPGSRVRVFTLRGERILDATADGTGTVTWMADNTAGRPVASGIYLVVVEANGTKNILKLVVVR